MRLFWRRSRPEMGEGVPQRGGLLPGRLRGLRRASADAGAAPQGDPDHKHAGAAVRRGAEAPEGDPQRVGREGGSQADVRGHGTGFGEVAADRGDRLRAAPARAGQEGSGRGIRKGERAAQQTENRGAPLQIIQHIRDLTCSSIPESPTRRPGTRGGNRAAPR